MNEIYEPPDVPKPDLREEVRELMGLVAENTQALKESEEQREKTEAMAKRLNHRSKLHAVALIGVAVLTLGLIWAFFEFKAQQDAIENNAVINCENANNSRAVQRNLWNGILDAPQDPGEPPPTEQEEKFREAFRMYINEAFGERDCSNLDKKYPEPEFPDLGGDA